MSFNNPNIGNNNTAEFITSGLPFVTSSTLSLGAITEVAFQRVTSFVTVRNASTGSEVLAVGFTRNGVIGSNNFKLNSGESFSADLRLYTVWLSGSVGSTINFTVLAGLTSIPTERLPPITGSTNVSGTYLGIG